MTLRGPAIFDEKNPTSWRLAALTALLVAVFALQVSPEFSLINAAISLSAAVVSLFDPIKLPRGLLGLWATVIFGVWLSPLAELPPADLRIVLATAVVFLSLVFQGPIGIYFGSLVLAYGLLLPSLSLDFSERTIGEILLDDSFQILQVGGALGAALLFLRISRGRTRSLLSTLHGLTEGLENTHTRLSTANDSVQLTRDQFLGRALTDGEVSFSDTVSDTPLDNLSTYEASLEDVVAALRKSFAEFQAQGRLAGTIAGPIRFVFFAPAAGYDEKSIISVDIDALLGGVYACLQLAHESLPEIGARRREGVIRLSIRYGLRVIEISVEDNGRGLIARNPEAEKKLNSLKELTYVWGGTFDRVARLGVGSRTSLELRILRERNRVYRTTLKHRLPKDSPAAVVPHV